jgi:phytanoyl-CoA hydroxylase
MIFKRLKLSYMIYNFFHKKRLKHNIRIYKLLNMNKRYFSPVSSKDFEGIDPEMLKNSNYTPVAETKLFGNLSQHDQQSLLDFDNNGFAILKNFIPKEVIDNINNTVESMLAKQELSFRYGNKIMFGYRKIEALRAIASDPDFVALLSALLTDDAKLFQSINFLSGSQQKTHSDSIHMTTFPLGGLLGVWVALEDIDDDNGPLHYYPGSHKLPYYLNKDYDNEGGFWLNGDKTYSAYEEMMRRKIEEFGLAKKTFKAKAGDVLIWHANLFHGGEPHLNKAKTRKSMVFHYYANNRVCYHEITQRPTLFE